MTLSRCPHTHPPQVTRTIWISPPSGTISEPISKPCRRRSCPKARRSTSRSRTACLFLPHHPNFPTASPISRVKPVCRRLSPVAIASRLRSVSGTAWQCGLNAQSGSFNGALGRLHRRGLAAGVFTQPNGSDSPGAMKPCFIPNMRWRPTLHPRSALAGAEICQVEHSSSAISG